MTKAQTIQDLRRIARSYKAKLRVTKNLPQGHGRYCNDGTIKMSSRSTINEILSTFFHELEHHRQVAAGKYKRYYYGDFSIKYAYYAELNTDKCGRHLMKRYYPKHKFRGSYGDKAYAIRWLQKFYNKKD